MNRKLYFILADENLFHPKFFLKLLKKLNQNYEVVGITLAKDTHKSGLINFIKQQLNLWGVIGFLYIGMKSFIYLILEKLNNKNSLSLKSIARKNNIKYVESFNVNDESHLEYLKKLKIDIIISSCGHIFKKDLLKLPKIACINRHSALLPKYGGVLPVFWAMVFEEKKFGVSIHYMVDKIDQGDILSQIEIPLKRENSLFKNYLLAFEKSVDAIILALENLDKNRIAVRFLPNEKQYFSFPSNEKIKELKEKGFKTFSLKDIFS